MNVAGQQSLDVARARFQAFGTTAQQPSSTPSPTVSPAVSAGVPSQSRPAGVAAARVRRELKDVRIKVPNNPSTLDVLNGFSRAMKTPGLSKEAVSRLYEMQTKIFEMHKESMNVVLSMGR